VKTLAEIAIEAGLVTRAGAAKAGKMAEERNEPLIAVLVRELGLDEVALVAALRKQTRVTLLDPAQVSIDPDALRVLARDACARLRVLPFALASDGPTRVLRVAMADPTDTSAILELEQLAQCEIEVSALPLSTIEELIDKGYRQHSTMVVPRHIEPAREVSVTAQVPLDTMIPLEARFAALCQLLVGKGLITEGELTEALRKLDGKS
jgi:hypothetical protein